MSGKAFRIPIMLSLAISLVVFCQIADAEVDRNSGIDIKRPHSFQKVKV